MTDVLLAFVAGILLAGMLLTGRLLLSWRKEQLDTLNALAEMLGEDIDRRIQHGE